MIVHAETIELHTKGFLEIHDLTREVAESAKRSGATDGMVNVYVVG